MLFVSKPTSSAPLPAGLAAAAVRRRGGAFLQPDKRFNGGIITRLDVLDELPVLKICTAYKLDGILSIISLPVYPNMTDVNPFTKNWMAGKHLPTIYGNMMICLRRRRNT
jgi:hypothetical protein